MPSVSGAVLRAFQAFPAAFLAILAGLNMLSVAASGENARSAGSRRSSGRLKSTKFPDDRHLVEANDAARLWSLKSILVLV